jgi:hypothetical protein
MRVSQKHTLCIHASGQNIVSRNMRYIEQKHNIKKARCCDESHTAAMQLGTWGVESETDRQTDRERQRERG